MSASGRKQPLGESVRTRLRTATVGKLHAFWVVFYAALEGYEDWPLGTVYVRESDVKSLEGDQPVVQLGEILRLFAARRVYVPWEYVYFENESATDVDRRGIMQSMLHLASTGLVHHAGFFEADRLARSTIDGPDIVRQFRQYGVAVTWLGRTDIDPRNPASWQSDQTQFAAAEYVSRSASYKVGINREAASQRGVPLGPLPEAYAVTKWGLAVRGRSGPPIEWSLVEPLASIIRQGRDLYMRVGGSFRDLADWSLTTDLRGITPAKRPMDREWWNDTLRNPKYAGYHVPSTYLGFSRDVTTKEKQERRRRRDRIDPADLVPCVLPPIFTLEEFTATLAVMRSRARSNSGRRPTRRSAVSGLLVDARCGHRMHILSRDADGSTRARCAESYSGRAPCSTSFRIDDIEGDIDAVVRCLDFTEPRLLQMVEGELASSRPAPRRMRPSEVQTEMARLRKVIVTAGPDRDIRLLAEGKLAVLERRHEAETRNDDDRRFAVAVADLQRWPAIWDAADGEARNRLLRTLVDGVEVVPTRRLPRGATRPTGGQPRAAEIIRLHPRNPMMGLAVAAAVESAKLGMERETGFEPATFSLGS